MKKLFLIPARGGSKGVPGKNIKPLAGKPLIWYTLEVASEIAEKGDEICVSTDSQEIVESVGKFGLKVPFVRPSTLASDAAGMRDVVLHAIEFYKSLEKEFDVIVLLQPTSPLRRSHHVKEAIELLDNNTNEVISVKRTKANPYFTLYEQDDKGFLHPSKHSEFKTRQECPDVWELNGSVYIYKMDAFLNPLESKVKKYEMKEQYSLDIDTLYDFFLAEILLTNQNFNSVI